MKPTPQQEAVVKFLLTEPGNVVVEACAGSGKTSTLVAGINALSGSMDIVCCAFNKRIAVELEERMPQNAYCATMNALGHRAWGKHIGQRLELNTRKSWDIANQLKLKVGEFPDFARLLGLAKAVGLVPEGACVQVEGLTPDDADRWQDLIDDHDLDTGSCQAPINVGRDGLRISIRQAFDAKIDFDDQLYMSTLWLSQLPTPDFVMVDEAQDISGIQRRMIRRMTIRGRLCAVGDRYQAIYAFRGADSQSIPRIEQEWDATTLPLTVSFRCPQMVVQEAQAYVPHIECAQAAPVGQVNYLEDSPFGADFLQPGDVIVCRNSKPLIALAFQLIKAGIGACVLGREIGQNLITMVKKFDVEDLEGLAAELEQYRVQRTNYLMSRHKEAQVQLLEDKVDSIFAICDLLGWHKTPRELCTAIEHMFQDSKGVVTLSTVHKAKGLEWDRVHFLDKYLIPSRFAKTQEDLQQEANIAYVGITRARKVLTYLDSKGYQR